MRGNRRDLHSRDRRQLRHAPMQVRAQHLEACEIQLLILAVSIF
jgi:hypothetical protein